MRRSSWIALTVTAVLVLVASVALGTSKAPAACGARGSATVYDDHEVRVFTREVAAGETRTVACSHLNGHRSRIAQDDSTGPLQAVGDISAPGRWLGYAVATYSSSASSGAACILRIRDGKRRCTRGPGVLGLGATRAGSLAWLSYDGIDYNGDGICCAVYKRDRGADNPVRLDSGPDIESDSFAVGGRRTYWTKAGQAQTATMP